jgi:parallel beta-helix repeat protein
VKYSGATGIAMDRTAWNNDVESNYVYATGTDQFGGDLMNGPSHGVYISGPAARVYNNRIDRTGSVGLYLSGDVLGRDVSYNYITNAGLALSDTGAIYMGSFYAGPEKDRIHHNIIEDSFGCRTMDKQYDLGTAPTIETYSGDAQGIYVDEEGNNRIIEYNTVIGSSFAGILFHWAPSNLLQKNTLYGNGVAQVYLSGKNEPRKILVDDVLIDNIMFATEAQQKTLYIGMNYDDVHFGQSDNNYFYNPYADRHVYVSRYVAGEDGAIQVVREDMTLSDWRGLSGYDGSSRDFAYLDQLGDIAINHDKSSRIIYNPSLEVMSVDLQSETYCDVEGNKIYGSVTLQPFESKILIRADFEIPQQGIDY